MNHVIAIDGPTASGKGTLARRMGEALGFKVLDTGLLYRAVGLAVVRAGGNPSDPAAAVPVARALDASNLTDDNEIRSDLAGQYASQCSAIPEVRAALLEFQRSFAAEAPGAILDGRDIGTVICPDAPLKLYITASPEVRAQRRHAELLSRGKQLTLDEVVADIKKRDDRDMNRPVAPLRPAKDAFILDTSLLDPAAVLGEALELARKKLNL